jgi:hypothetical protein
MNPYIIIAIISACIIGALALILRQGFVILLFWLVLFGIFGVGLWIAYKVIFPPGWKNQ